MKALVPPLAAPSSPDSPASRLLESALHVHTFKRRVPETVWFDFGEDATSRRYTLFITHESRLLTVLNIRFERPLPTLPSATYVNDTPTLLSNFLGLSQVSAFPGDRRLFIVQTLGLQAPVHFTALTGASPAPSLVLI